MTVAHRRVRTVALSAPSESLVRRGATMLADALRIASLPGASPGRLLVVRSLSVGDIHPDASPASLALSIDRRVLELDASAVSWADAGAGRAPAVVFRDDVEPYVAFALRLARGEPVDAWFWPLAVSGWRPSMSRDDAARAVLAAVLRTRAGPGGLLRLVDELGARGALDPVLEAVRELDGPDLLRQCGWDPTAAEPPAPPASRHVPSAAATARGWTGALERWVTRWTATDARSVWLVAMALAARQPARLGDRGLPGLAARVAGEIAARAPERPSTTIGSRRDDGPGAAEAGDGENRGAPVSVAAAGAFGLAEATDHAGLFFVVPILAWLGMAPFLESHPDLVELDLPGRLLHRLSERLAIPAGDPVRHALGAPPASAPGERYDFTVPARWCTGLARRDPLIVRRGPAPGTRVLFDRSGVLPLALWRDRAPAAARALLAGSRLRRGRPAGAATDADVLVAAWLGAIRRWSRRYARMGLGALVRRPGRIAATRSHVDLVFAHRHADARLRTSGLDLDPGWVPWLGRVVRFHYHDD
jgi:hypothetical protein